MSGHLSNFRKSLNSTINQIAQHREHTKAISKIEQDNQAKRDRQNDILNRIKQLALSKKKRFSSICKRNTYFVPPNKSMDLTTTIDKIKAKAVQLDKSVDFTSQWKHNTTKLTLFGSYQYQPTQASQLPAINKSALKWTPNQFNGGYFGKFKRGSKDIYVDTKTRWLAVNSTRITEKRIWHR